MASSYPAALDTFPAHVDGTSPQDARPEAVLTAAEVNKIQDAISAVQAEMGVNPSAGSATVAERLASLVGAVNVKDAGAACDGVTDDWPIVRNLLAAGGNIFIPAGTHRWRLTAAGATSLPAGTRIFGTPGARPVILLESDAASQDRAWLMAAGDNVVLEDLDVRRNNVCGIICVRPGPYSGLTVNRVRFDGKTSVHGNTFGFHPFQLGAHGGVSRNVTITGCEITGAGFGLFQTNTATGQTSDIEVSRCWFHGNYNDDLEFNGPLGAIRGVRVLGNVFEDNQNAMAGNGFAVGAATARNVLVEGNVVRGYFGEALHFEDYCQGVKVVDNYVIDAGAAGYQWVSLLAGINDVLFRGNTFISTATSPVASAIFASQPGGTGPTPSGGTFAPPRDVEIVGNRLYAAGPINGFYLDSTVRHTIRGNVIASTGSMATGYTGPSTYAFAASGSTATDLAILDNTIRGWRHGILPQYDATVNLGVGYRVEGNDFTDCKYGIGAQNLGSGSISRNRFRNCESPLYVTYQGAAAGSGRIVDNDFQGCTNSPVIYGVCPVVASAARAAGSAVAGTVFNITAGIPAGTKIYWDGGAVTTLTVFAQVDAVSLVGDVTAPGVAQYEQGLAYWAWSSDPTKVAEITGNTDSKLGAAGYGVKAVAVGVNYATKGWEQAILAWAPVAVTLQPAAHCPGREVAVANTSAGTVTVASRGGQVGTAATSPIPAGSAKSWVSDGVNWNPLTSGGTPVTLTADGALTVNNITVSLATDAEVAAALATKADTATVTTALAAKADTTAISPAVTAALAADATIRSDLTTRIGALTAADLALIRGTNSLDLPALSITDNADRRSWLEIGPDGGPTTQVVTQFLAPVIAANALAANQAPALGTAMAITDTADRVALLIDSAGQVDLNPGPRLQAQITAAVAAAPASPSLMYADERGATRRITSGPDYCHAGDSLTASGRIASRLAELTGRTHRVAAVGGENSYGIAARLNALPYLMRPVDSSGTPLTQWPASGAVDVTFTPALGGNSWPLLQGTGGSARGRLASPDGTAWDFSIRVKDAGTVYPYHGAGDIYQLTRVTAGAAIPVKAPVPFLYEYGTSRRDDVLILGIGQNSSGGTGDLAGDAGTRAAIEAIVGQLPPAGRYLIWTATGPESTGVTSHEQALMARWGRRFVNVRRYLIDQALSDLGLTPTATDTTDIAAGRVPTQLRTDAVHHTTTAQEAIAEFLFYPRLKEMGWI